MLVKLVFYISLILSLLLLVMGVVTLNLLILVAGVLLVFATFLIKSIFKVRFFNAY